MLHTNSAAGDFRRLRQIRSKIMTLHQSALCSPSQVEELRSMGVELKGLSQTSLGRIIAALAEQTVANLLRVHANAYELKATPITSNCSTPSSKRKPRDASNVASNSSTEGYSNPRSLVCLAAEAVAVGFAPGLSLPNRRTSGSSFESISASTPASFGEECDKSDESEGESDTESEDEEPMSDDQFYQTFIPEHLQSHVLVHHIPNLFKSLPSAVKIPVMYSALISSLMPHPQLHKHIRPLLKQLWECKTLEKTSTTIYDWGTRIARTAGFKRGFHILLAKRYNLARISKHKTAIRVLEGERDAFYAFWKRVRCPDVEIETDEFLETPGKQKRLRDMEDPDFDGEYSGDESNEFEKYYAEDGLKKTTLFTSAIKTQMAGLALSQDSNTLLSYLAPIDQNNNNPHSISRDVDLESGIATLHLRSYLEFLLFCRTGCPCTSGKPCLEALKNWTLHHAKNLIDAVNAHLLTCSRQLKSPDEASTTPLESTLKDLLELFTVSVILGLQIIISDPSNHSNRVCAVTLQLLKDTSSLIATNLTLLKTVRASGHIKLLSKFYGAAEALADYPESLYIARRVLHAVSLGVKRGGSNTMDVYSSEWEPSPREAVQLLALSEKIPSLMRKIEERMKGFRDIIRHEPVVDGWVIPTPYLNKRASRTSSGFPTTPLIRRLSNRPELETNLFPLDSDGYNSESDNPDSPHLKRHKKLEGLEATRFPLEVEIVDPLPITEIDDMLAVRDTHAVDCNENKEGRSW